MTTINNEVEKPDDATLILKRVLNATPEMDATGTGNGGSIG